MAIDYNAGINSIDVGAHDITYSDNEGPKSPEQKEMMSGVDTPVFEMRSLDLLLDEFREDNNGQNPHSIDDLRRFFYNKYGPEGIAKVEQAVQQAEQQAQMQEQREGIQMATAADPMLQEEYDKYVFEMQEMGQEPMSLEDFRQQAVAGMATGGRVPDIGFSKVQPSKDGSRPGYFRAAEREARLEGKDMSPRTSAASDVIGPTIRDERDAIPPPDLSSLRWTDQYEDLGLTPDLVTGNVPGDDPTNLKIERDWGPDPETEREKIEEFEKTLRGLGNVKSPVDKAKDFFLPAWAMVKGLEGKHNAWRRKRFLTNYLKNKSPQQLSILGIEGWEDWDEEKWNDPNTRALLDTLGYADTLKGPTGHDGGGPSAEGIASTLPLWQQQGFNSYEDWLAAQGTGTTTTTPDIPTASASLPYTVNPNADDLTQGRGGWFYNDGGRVGYAGGGDVRQRYLFGGLGKIFKKITKPIKKITKSKAGRAAMLALAGYYLGGGQGLGGSRMFGTKFGENFALKNLMNRKGAGFLMGGGEDDKYEGKWNPWKVGIAGLSLAPFLMGDDDEEDENKMYEDWLREKAKWDATYKAIPTTSLPSPYSRYLMGAADGGRIGYQGGGYNDEDEEEDHRVAALRALYGMRRGAQEGGLMDMGGMEKDYREEGGFVPIGGQERADDVPARLSKNEFVFTADAVRAAGGGDIDRGAEVMENVMENLEQGGNVSEESQGLEGARNMFATSQRLEGVL